MQANAKQDPYVLVGTVLDASAQERAHVSGGGSRRAWNNELVIDPVNTSHEKTTMFWVRSDDGLDVRAEIKRADIPLRAGHRVAVLLWGSRVLAVRNANTGKRDNVLGARDLVRKAPSFGFAAVYGWTVLAYVLMTLVVGFRLEPLLIAVLVGLFVSAFFHSGKMRTYRAEVAKAQTFLDFWGRKLDETRLCAEAPVAVSEG